MTRRNFLRASAGFGLLPLHVEERILVLFPGDPRHELRVRRPYGREGEDAARREPPEGVSFFLVSNESRHLQSLPRRSLSQRLGRRRSLYEERRAVFGALL